jgi:prophage antirepressor-like protein
VLQGRVHDVEEDVAAVLAIQNPADLASKQLDQAGLDKIYTSHPTGRKLATFINEPNLYRVIFRSNKPEARKFQDWVFNTVLPTIRATGGFTTKAPAAVYLTTAQRKVLTERVKEAVAPIGYQEAAKFAIYARLRKEFGIPAVHHLTPSQYSPALEIIDECRCDIQRFVRDVETSEQRYVRAMSSASPHQILQACRCLDYQCVRPEFEASAAKKLLDRIESSIGIVPEGDFAWGWRDPETLPEIQALYEEETA